MTITLTEETDTVTTPAIDVAVDTLAFIKANPSEWNQHSWRSCFAGHFARLDPMAQIVTLSTCDCGCGSEVTGFAASDGRTLSVVDWFTERLGKDAREMTRGSNTIEELEAAVVALKDGGSVEDAMMAVRLRPFLTGGATR